MENNKEYGHFTQKSLQICRYGNSLTCIVLLVCLAVSPGKHAVCQATMVVPLWDSEGSDGQDESTNQPENGTKVTKRRHVQLQIKSGTNKDSTGRWKNAYACM